MVNICALNYSKEFLIPRIIEHSLVACQFFLLLLRWRSFLLLLLLLLLSSSFATEGPSTRIYNEGQKC